MASRRPDLELVDPNAPVEPAGGDQEWSTGEKVAAGAGIAAGLSLLGFGAYKLGERLGWWRSDDAIIHDESDRGGKDTDGGGGNGGGGDRPSGGARAIGNPPNMSGDGLGYNSQMFPSPFAVRTAMKALGYNIEIGLAPLVGEAETHGEVRRFQQDWNRVIRAIDSRKIKLPSSPKNSTYLKHYRGLLDADDVPGKYTLRALEIITRNAIVNSIKFTDLRKAAK